MNDGMPFSDRWLNPALIDCSCRHCRKGRMCRHMADLFRRCARRDGELIRDLDRRLETWSAMSEMEQDEAVEAWMPVRSGVVWVMEP